MAREGFVGGWPGWMLAALYARGVALARTRALRRPPVRPDVPVISIGNLAVGGTGKTPFTIHAAGRLLAGGARVEIVARPVGGAVPGAAGDEIRVLEERLPGVRVHAAREKSLGALAAARVLAAGGRGPAAVLVDDGFSHWALARDLDVVLVDLARPLGNGHLLPLGLLREPPTALARAHVIVGTRADRVPLAERDEVLGALARLAPAAHLATSALAPRGLRSEGGLGRPLAAEAGQRVVCLSGLARAGELAGSASRLGLAVEEDLSYADHHRFSDAEWHSAEAAAARTGALLLVSHKDAVRLPAEKRAKTVVLEVDWQWLSGGDEVERRLIETARGTAGGRAA
ncbi:MAG: tetraacyldisaccharide 4'-kinase [Candidatus Eiseniibacteriota bacterium]